MDWRTPPPSGASPAPAEGLPPCVNRIVIFEGRQATWHLRDSCPDPLVHSGKYWVCVGHRSGNSIPYHDVDITRIQIPPFVNMGTDDPDEAQAAFERGAEWVRTGEMA